MGQRELKRVPLDFEWPLGKIWYGYTISHCSEDYYGDEDSCLYCKMFAKTMGIPIERSCPNYTRYDPPKGAGFQLWETTSEGSPKSPVFKTPEELADWCTGNTTVFGYEKASYETWLKMFIEDNTEMSCTMIADTGTGYIGSIANEPEEEKGR